MRGKKSKWAKGGFASHARPQNDPARFHETGSPINHIGRTRRRPLWPSSAVLNWQIHSLWSAAAPARKKRGGEQPIAGRFADRDLASLERSAAAGKRLAGEQADRHRGGADRVGGQDHEGAGGVEQLLDRAQKLGQVIEDLPHLLVRPAPEFRRIDQDAVVGAAAAPLACRELAGVVEYPADRRALQSERTWFSFAHSIALFDASTWVTCAPAAAASSDATPV